MQLYARRGVADWKTAPSQLRTRAMQCLGTRIADNEHEAVATLNMVFDPTNPGALRFIPMPEHPGNRGFERSFFVPVLEYVKGQPRIGFELFLVVNGYNCLAYRFEAAHAAPTVHDYGHVQLTRQLLRKTIPSRTPQWLPERYPAHPLFTSDPLKMFLSMATSVHGNTNGVLRVIDEIFTGANRAKEAMFYIAQVKKLLN